MPGQIFVNRAICIISALALLVTVVTSPVRSWGPLDLLSPPPILGNSLVVPLVHPAHLFLKSVSLRVAPVKAVPSEKDEEEKISGDSLQTRLAGGMPPALSPGKSARALPSFASSPTSLPLRC